MIGEIWQSLRRMPLWVQIWMGLILVPVNLASLGFVSEPGGAWIAFLAIGGMTPNAVLLLRDRGFSRAMALAHLVFWPPLLVLLWPLLGHSGFCTPFCRYATLLFAVNAVSLLFDLRDAWLWWQGARGVV